MKRILLSSACIVGFAGAAAADGHASVTFNGDAELGYNDDFNAGIFWSLGLTLGASATLDNGLTAAISGDVELNNNVGSALNSASLSTSTFDGNAVTIDDLVVSLSSDTASLSFGDVAPAAESMYTSAVTNIEADSFYDEDAVAGVDGDAVILGTATFGATSVGLSYGVGDTNGGTSDDDLDGLQLVVNTSFANVDLSMGYQEATLIGPTTGGVTTPSTETFAISASTTLSGFDVGVAYADDSVETSMGVQVGYTVGNITGTVFYVANDVAAKDNYGVAVDYVAGPLTLGALYHDGNDEDIQVNATYDVGNGLNVFAGYRDEGSIVVDDEYFYIGGDYDLGGGGNLRVSYADTGAGVGTTLDELGAAEDVKDGTTIALSFAF